MQEVPKPPSAPLLPQQLKLPELAELAELADLLLVLLQLLALGGGAGWTGATPCRQKGKEKLEETKMVQRSAAEVAQDAAKREKEARTLAASSVFQCTTR